MFRESSGTPLFSERAAFYGVFAVISFVLAIGSIGVVFWIGGQLTAREPAPPSSPIYTNYSPAPTDYLKPSSIAAMNAYIKEHPQPQNVQILTGMSTAQIANYMTGQMSGGLKVDCTFCHILGDNNNFANEGNPNKDLSRKMMLMAADLNKNYVAQLPASVGAKQITCATCHNGKPVNFNGGGTPAVLSNYPSDQSPLAQDFRLRLDSLDELNALQLTGKDDPNLAAVQYNQYVMQHFNQSLGVGCAYCHNANYFPSNEIPQKGYALTMLQMSQHMNQEYLSIMNNKVPSCWMCHRGQQLPPGSANPGQVPEQLGYEPKTP